MSQRRETYLFGHGFAHRLIWEAGLQGLVRRRPVICSWGCRRERGEQFSRELGEWLGARFSSRDGFMAESLLEFSPPPNFSCAYFTTALQFLRYWG